MQNLPPPLVPDDVDLRDFPFTPMFRARLFGSSFHARVSDAGWRAGVTLWLKAWDQMPAGTLPDDEIDLCRLAELGRDIKTWRKVSKEALWGWFKCSDGRLHHRTVAEGVMEAWERKQAQRNRTEAARLARAGKRTQQSADDETTDNVTKTVTASVTENSVSVTEDEQGSKPASNASQFGGKIVAPQRTGKNGATQHETETDLLAVKNSTKSIHGSYVTDDVTETVTGSKRQGQGQRQERTDASHPLRARSTHPDDSWPSDCFDQWYRAFPRHIGKDDAKRSFDRLRKSGKVTWAALFAATEQFARKLRLNPPDDPKFIPHPATWLNKGRWADEPDKPVFFNASTNNGTPRNDRPSSISAAVDRFRSRFGGEENPSVREPRGPELVRLEVLEPGFDPDRGDKLL